MVTRLHDSFHPSPLSAGLPGDSPEHCSAPNPGGGSSSGGGERRHGPPPETMASANTTITTSALSSGFSSPSSSTAKHQHQQYLPGRRGPRGGGGSGSGTSGGGFTSGGSGTSATVFNSVADPAEDHHCSLRGLVWKVLLGTIHTDSALYVRLVGKGPSSEDVKIKEDTFRTFPRDEEFRRRVHEHKLSRINNAYVRLHRPPECGAAAGTAAAAAATNESRGLGDTGWEGGNSSSIDNKDGSGCRDKRQPEKPDDFFGTSSSAADGPGAEAGLDGDDGVASANRSGGAVAEATQGEGGGGDRGKGHYVQGMMVLCAPLLFVMPEVDAFFCFNSLLNQHMPR